MPRDPKKINSYIFFDFETGGLHPNENPAMSFAALAVDGVGLNEILRYDTLIKPYDEKLVYTPAALRVNGLTVEQCRLKGITLRQLGEDIKQFVDEANIHKSRTGGKPIFVGHNADFDRNFLVDILRRTNTDLSKAVAGTFDYSHTFIPEVIDTQNLNKIMTAEITDHDTKFKLINCCQRAGVEITDAHNALNDVVATGDLFRYMATRLRSGSSEVTVSAGKASVHRSNFEWR